MIKISNYDSLEINDKYLSVNGKSLCEITYLTKDDIESKMDKAASNLWNILDSFIENTLDYAKRKRTNYQPGKIAKIVYQYERSPCPCGDKGEGYREDLRAIRTYIDEVNPIMIGVDGGANALLDFGYRPDIIIGDMDSVSDISLMNCKEIIVHAYPNGNCPGMKRIESLGLKAVKFPFIGTSEDAALVLAYEQNAELIVTVGSHTNMIDFLEKEDQEWPAQC